MGPDNLELPCIQPPLPYGRHGHVGHVGQGGRGEHGGQDRKGQDRIKLTFEVDFPGNLGLAAFAIIAMFFPNVFMRIQYFLVLSENWQ